MLCQSYPYKVVACSDEDRLIDFNYFFSGYLSDAYWSSWLVVTHELTVSLLHHILPNTSDHVASRVLLHAEYPHRGIDRLCLPCWYGYAIHPSIQAYPNVWSSRQDHVSMLIFIFRLLLC